MTRHIITKQRLREIPSIKELNGVFDKCVLSEEERLILERLYIQKKSIVSVAMELHCSESCIKAKHRSIINRIGYILDEE